MVITHTAKCRRGFGFTSVMYHSQQRWAGYVARVSVEQEAKSRKPSMHQLGSKRLSSSAPMAIASGKSMRG